MPETKNVFHAKSKKAWREWLEKHHCDEQNVMLVRYKKHTDKPSISHKDAMDEAICFGWIDTIVKRIDDEKSAIFFSKRNSRSKWSINTLSYAKKLIKKGRMTEAGMKAYKEGLKRPLTGHNLAANPDVPPDLEKILKKNAGAAEYFYNLAPSHRKVYIYWIEKAVRKETRIKRIKETVDRCAGHKTLGIK